MEKDVLEVDIKGYKAELPILPLPSGIKIAFFNLHGNQELTEHCGKELAKLLSDCDVLVTAESKGLQLTHVAARELGMHYYAVARKSKKLYMQDGIEITIKSSITTGAIQKLYLSRHDADLLKGKKWASWTTWFPRAPASKGWKSWCRKRAARCTKRRLCSPRATRPTVRT